MTASDRQRLAIAVAHAVDGAALTLRCESGDEILVARHPAADLSPCVLRAAFLASGGGAERQAFDQVVELRLGGSLIDLGAGILGAQSVDGRLHRWIASTLDAEACVEVLERIDARGELEARVVPDVDLGTSVIRLDAERADLAHLERAAVAAAAAVMAEELLTELAPPRISGR